MVPRQLHAIHQNTSPSQLAEGLQILSVYSLRSVELHSDGITVCVFGTGERLIDELAFRGWQRLNDRTWHLPLHDSIPAEDDIEHARRVGNIDRKQLKALGEGGAE